jgi:hypothetical protein
MVGPLEQLETGQSEARKIDKGQSSFITGGTTADTVIGIFS